MTREQVCEFVREAGWKVWVKSATAFPGGLLPPEAITPYIGVINLIMETLREPRVLRSSPKAPLREEYPWRVAFYGYRTVRPFKGERVGYFTPRILFRTKEEACACVTTIEILRRMS